MKKFLFLIIALLALGGLIISGCAQKKVAPPSETAGVGQDQRDVKKDDLSKIQQPTDRKKPDEFITEKQLAKAKTDDIESSVIELQKKIQDVYFDYDKYNIRDDSKPIIKNLADMLSKNLMIKVVIEGHCDERGTNEYNLGLGDKRAHAVKQYLMSLGIPSKRIETVSYGEEKPICRDSNEDCWAKNRRAHFVLLGEK